MFYHVIKTVFVYFCFLYIKTKIEHTAIFTIHTLFKHAGISIAMSVLALFCEFLFEIPIYFFPVFLYWIIEGLNNSQPQRTFVISTISLGLSFSLYAISIFITLIVLFPIYHNPTSFPYGLCATISVLLQVSFCYVLFRIKRFQKGMFFLMNNPQNNVITLLCLLFIFISTYVTFNRQHLFIQTCGLISVVFTLAFLIYWWQAQITKSYRRNLELRELESLRTEIAEKESVIQKLMKDNENLARISHRDNSLISALKDSTVKYLSTDYKSPAEAIATRDKLISNINTLSAGRNSLPHTYGERTPREFDTGLSLLDDLLHHMDKEALEQDIMLSVHFGTLLKDFVPENVSESDLTHIVDDLLKNAFKSTRTCESRAVQLQFYKAWKTPCHRSC